MCSFRSLRLLLVASALFLAGCPDTMETTVDAGDAGNTDTGGDAGDTGDTGDAGSSGVAVIYDKEGPRFTDMPWPSDARRRADGSPDLSDFPQRNDAFIARYIRAIENNADGFATMPVAFFAMDGVIDATLLPEPADTMSADSPIQLIDVTLADCGGRVPVNSVFREERDRYRSANTLAVSPSFGFVLEPSRTYAVVVLRSLGVHRPAGFIEDLRGESSDPEAGALMPLRFCLDDAGIDIDDIAVATVFTTQDPVAETVRMREVALDAGTRAEFTSAFTLDEQGSRDGEWQSFVATFDAPLFMSGESPFETQGGVVRDGEGTPIVQQFESVPMIVSIPEGATGPLPVLIWQDGTGASMRGHIGDSPFRAAIDDGFAVVSFVPQFHDVRATPNSDEIFSSFNFQNPEAGRVVFRQQAVEVSFVIRLMREHFANIDVLPAFDLDKIVYGGHSQGALVGALVAGLEPDIDAFVLNGTGGYLSQTIVERDDLIDIAELVSGILQFPEANVERFHPMIQLAQLGAEPVDPQNYIRRWRGWDENPEGSNVYVINGDMDDTTHVTSVNHMTVIGDLALIEPAGWDPDETGVWQGGEESLPISGNRTSVGGTPITHATWLESEGSHYTIYRESAPRELAANFWLSALSGTPILE